MSRVVIGVLLIASIIGIYFLVDSKATSNSPEELESGFGKNSTIDKSIDEKSAFTVTETVSPQLSSGTKQEAWLGKNAPSMYTIAGKNYFLKRDCAFDIAKNVYEMINNTQQGKAWLEERGYHLFYGNQQLLHYQNYDTETLVSLAESGDPVAMSRIAMHYLFDDDPDGELFVETLENMFVRTGSFPALHLLTINLDFVDGMTSEDINNWYALRQEVNGLNIFGYSSLGVPTLSEKNKLWAKNKLEEIDRKRGELGLPAIQRDSLPSDLDSEVKRYQTFVTEQEKLGVGWNCL